MSRDPARAAGTTANRPGTRTASRPRGFERRVPPPSRPSAKRRVVTGGVPHKRVGVMRVVILLSFLALALRLVAVQLFSGGHFAAIGAAEVTSTVQVPAARGGIYDRNGAVLSVSVPRATVVADDFLIAHPGQAADALAPVLGIPAATLVAKLSERSGYVPLVHKLDDATAAKVRALNVAGITLLPDSQRMDPAGTLAAPVVGIVNGSGQGASGIEYRYNALLAGRNGTEIVQRTPDDVPLPGGAMPGTAAEAGSGIELTLDEPLQYVTEQSLGAEITASHAKSGIAVVMDSHTGAILSMADLVADPKTAAVTQAPSNLAVTKVYEPGSVFKLVTFSAALQAGVITPQQMFSVPNQLTIDGWVFHDAENHPTEQLSATQILAQSSNIGTIEIAGALGRDRLASQISDLGFGQPTGLHFPGESAGIVKANAATWAGSDMGSTPIGQDDAVTAQQVLDMVNSVATGGVFVPPHLVRATIGADGALHTPAAAATHRVLTSTVAAELTTMMEQVVQDGTAVSAGVPGYTVAGKTGTAQVPDTQHGGYIPGAYMATFAGFAPAEHPVLSAIVVLEQPTPIFGGVVAAPVFSQVMRYALHRYGIPTSLSASGGTAASVPLSPTTPTTTVPPGGTGSAGTIGPTSGTATGTP
ncbi:MAG: peptidoglycan D,D-transpeptidase FtsI family protein [Acidimicrobiales bacterium]